MLAKRGALADTPPQPQGGFGLASAQGGSEAVTPRVHAVNPCASEGSTRNKDEVGDVGGNCQRDQSEAAELHSGQSEARSEGPQPLASPEDPGPAPR